MEGSAGAPPQRVCPNCARISWATGPQCPYCRASFRRKGNIAPFAWMLTAAVLLIVAAFVIGLLVAGQRFNNELDNRSSDLQTSFNQSVEQVRSDVTRELNQRLPDSGTTPAPSATPAPGATPAPSATPVPSVTPAAGETATPSPTPSPLGGA